MITPDKIAEAESTRAVRVFLCYRRADGTWHAEWMEKQLANLQYLDRGGARCRLEVYFDKSAPGASDWKTRHFKALEASHALVLVCTPGIAKELSRHGQQDWLYEELRWWTGNRRTAPIVIDATGEGERWLADLILKKWPDINRIDLRREDAEAALRAGDLAFAGRVRQRIVASIQESERASTFEDLERSQKQARHLKVALVGMSGMLAIALAFGALVVRLDLENRRANAQLAATADNLVKANNLLRVNLVKAFNKTARIPFDRVSVDARDYDEIRSIIRTLDELGARELVLSGHVGEFCVEEESGRLAEKPSATMQCGYSEQYSLARGQGLSESLRRLVTEVAPKKMKVKSMTSGAESPDPAHPYPSSAAKFASWQIAAFENNRVELSVSW